MAIDDFHTPIYMGVNGHVNFSCRGRGHPEHTIVVAGALRGQNRRCAQDIITSLGAAVIGNSMLTALNHDRLARASLQTGAVDGR